MRRLRLPSAFHALFFHNTAISSSVYIIGAGPPSSRIITLGFFLHYWISQHLFVGARIVESKLRL